MPSIIARIRANLSGGKPKEAPAKHIEIWGHLLATQRFYKRLAVACVVLAGVGMAGGAYGMLVAMHRPLVFHVDGAGRATAMGRIGDNLAPVEAEVIYVAKRFMKTTIAFHSDTVELDLADGFNLMTDELQSKFQRQFADYQAERGMSFAAFVKRQQIRTVLDFKSLEIDNHNDRAWSVHMRGIAKTWPLSRTGVDSGFQAREFEAQLTLVRAPRTELTPNGILVAAQSSRFYEVEDPATLQEERVVQ